MKVQPEEALAIMKDIGKAKLLIKWKELPDFENSWEDLSAIKEQFPISTLRTRWFLRGEY